MDWRKSKHILVVALIVLNVFLYLGVQRHRGHVSRVNDREQMAVLTTELEKSGISLKTAIPKYEEKVFTLEVAYERDNPRRLNEMLFEEKGKIDYIGDEGVTLSHGGECFTFKGQNELIYKKDKSGEGKPMDEKSVIQDIVPTFFRRLEINMDDMDLEHITAEADGKRYRLYYGMVYDGVPLERAYTKVEVEQNQVIAMERKWLVVERKNENQVELPDPIKVLFSLVGNLTYDGKSIVGLDVCQYFNTSMGADVMDNKNISRGRTMPAWRITFDDGSDIVIDD